MARMVDLKALGSYEQVIATFRKFDTNKDNKWSFAEFHELMSQLNQGNWSERYTDRMMQQLDRNQNGAVDLDELIAYIFPKGDAMGGGAGNSEYENVIEAFRRHDANKNGTLCKAEFTRLMAALKRRQGKTWDERQTDKVFAAVDKDGSGEVDTEEIVAWLFGVPQDRRDAARHARRAERHNDAAGVERAGASVVIEFVCGSKAEANVDRIKEDWKRKLKGQVEVKKTVSGNSNTILKCSARNGQVVFWDQATMVAFRESPFESSNSTKEWSRDMIARHIPRLVSGSS